MLDLTPTKPASLEAMADKLAAHLYRLIQKVAEAVCYTDQLFALLRCHTVGLQLHMEAQNRTETLNP